MTTKYWLLILPLMLGSEGHHAMTINMTRLVYRYQGASIPPPYQRNAEITVDAEKIHVLITSVDEVLIDAEQAAPAGILPRLTQWLQDYHLTALPRQTMQLNLPPNTGAAIHALTIYDGENKRLDASTARDCGTAEPNGEESALLSGDIEGFARRLTREVANYDTYMRTP
jgi:hypothetical protein